MAKRRKRVSRSLQEKWYQNHIDSIASERYEPFWRVEDVNSYGIKVKVRAFNDYQRVVHLLSINELFMYMLIAWDSEIIECYEQYALPLDDSLEIAKELKIKHPVYSDSRVPIIQTIDFLCIRTDGSKIAFPVKQAGATEHHRTAEKLAIQEGYCSKKGISYQIVTSEELKTEHCQNLNRLYKHSELDSLLIEVFKVWLENFIGILADDRHERAANILEKSAETTGISYERATHFFFYSLWNGLLIFNWSRPLYLEKAASDLEIYSNDA